MICNQPENVPLAAQQSVTSSREIIMDRFEINHGLHTAVGSSDLVGWVLEVCGCCVSPRAESRWPWRAALG